MTVLITGAASGIGAATARRLSKRTGVVIADRNIEAAARLADEISAGGGTAWAAEIDVTSRASIAAMMDKVAAEAGPVHGLFNNAGISIRQRIEDITETAWDAVIQTHVKGTFLVSQAVLPQMLERGSGVIVNSSSDFAVIGVPRAAAYAAAKTAVYALTKAMTVEFAGSGIRVNAIGPGPIDTPMLRAGRSPAEAEAAIEANRQRVPMKRLGRPEEVAAVVDFLLSERSAYIAGQLIHPNGGVLSW
ncbi:MAG: SDR family NAD(P)-dependent oxidoreductase [Hyphomicrobiaceae bacterium]